MSHQRKRHRPDTVTAEKVEQGIASIREAYRIGRETLERTGRRAKYRGAVMQEEAKRLSLNETVVRKLRQIADPKEGFTEQELEALFSLCRKMQWVIGPSYLYKFVSIPKNHRQREKFIREAARGGWNRARIDLEIRFRHRQRPYGGRSPQIPEGANAVRLQATRMCERWLNWFEELQRRTDVPELHGLLDSLTKELPAARRAVRRLHEKLMEQQQSEE